MSRRQTFFDMVLSTHVRDGVVRISVAEFDNKESSEEQDKKPPAFFESNVLVTSLPGLLQLHRQINQVIEGLETKGIIKKNEKEDSKPGKKH